MFGKISKKIILGTLLTLLVVGGITGYLTYLFLTRPTETPAGTYVQSVPTVSGAVTQEVPKPLTQAPAPVQTPEPTSVVPQVGTTDETAPWTLPDFNSC